MPQVVDHDMRHRQVTDAARHVVARGGLEALTFRAVAAEAGFSVRLVQYYFGDKHGLLAATHRAVIADAAARFRDGVTPDGVPEPRCVLRGVLVALLPLDAERRAEAVVLAAFHAAALTSDAVDPRALLGAPRLLADVVAEQLQRAHRRGEDVTLEAELVVATVAGLSQGLLAGQHESERALELVEHLLDRLFGPST